MHLLDEEAQRWYCCKDDKMYFAKEQRWAVGASDVWVPILWLVGILFLGILGFIYSFLYSPAPSLLGWFLGLLGLIGATIYVYSSSKRFGIEGGRAIITFLFAIVGLPLYSYELHKLRKAQQAGLVRILVEPTAKPQQSVNGRQVADVVKPTKFCRECGAKIPRDSTYCEECGANLG